MANTVTRKFEVYHITAIDVTVDDNMEINREVVADFEVHDMAMNEAKARSAVREMLGAQRLPATVKVGYKLIDTRTYSMPVPQFIANATIVSTITVEEEN